MHLPRFNAFPANGTAFRRTAQRRATQTAAARRKAQTDHEFTRLCGSIILIAEEGRAATADELCGTYGFKPIFLQSHGARAAAHVATKRPDLADALGHMKGAQ